MNLSQLRFYYTQFDTSFIFFKLINLLLLINKVKVDNIWVNTSLWIRIWSINKFKNKKYHSAETIQKIKHQNGKKKQNLYP